jgi:hypothetical protein
MNIQSSTEQSPDTVFHGAAQDLPAYAPHSHIPSRRRNTIGPSLFCIPVSGSEVSEHQATQMQERKLTHR